MVEMTGAPMKNKKFFIFVCVLQFATISDIFFFEMLIQKKKIFFIFKDGFLKR